MRLPEETVEVICCDEGELEYLQEEIEWLAEDVCELDEHQDAILHLMAEMCKANMWMLEVIKDQDEDIKDLKSKFDFHDVTILILFIVFLIWNVVLSYNVFF